MKGGASHLVNLVDRILLVHAKGFDCEYLIGILFIGELPNISKSPRRERSFARDAEREGNCVRNGKDPIQTTRLS
jgi:hypothetical protein